MDWNAFWDVLNKIAIVGTIIGIPATLYGIYILIDNSIVIYDMYREPNDAGGMTLCIGNFTRKDCRIGKKENPDREYHIKGKREENANWK